MGDATWAVLITQVVVFLSTVVGFWYNGWKSAQERKWAKEDRDVQTAKITDTLASNKAEVLAQTKKAANEVHLGTKKNLTRVEKKIDENTDISKSAFTEANNVNFKIASAMERTAALEDRFDVMMDTLFKIEDVVLPKKKLGRNVADHTATDMALGDQVITTPGPAKVVVSKVAVSKRRKII